MCYKSREWKVRLIFSLCLLLTVLLSCHPAQAAKRSVSAELSKTAVTVGKQLAIEAKTKGVTYATSDPTCATVDANGVITAKKEGTAIITVRKKGYASKKFSIQVKKYGNYPSIPMTLDETDIALDIEEDALLAAVTNNAEKGTIKKITYTYQMTVPCAAKESEQEELPEEEHDALVQEDSKEPDADSEQPVQDELIPIGGEEADAAQMQTFKISFTVKNIAPGETKEVSRSGEFGAMDVSDAELVRVELQTGKVVLKYNVTEKRLKTTWTIQDDTPPTISGWVGKDSYNSKDVYMVAYPDRDYDFTKYVTASDDMGGKPKLTVDTSKINWKKSGTYTITFQATDLAGNIAKKNAKVQVRTVGELDRMADVILKGLVKDSWSDQKKAEAIYRYMRKNYSYVDSNDHASWENSAKYGLRYGSGNCFVYYSVSRLLLTRCGIPNIEVKRSAGSSHGHWWNYVYIDGGWYHFDTTPRRRRATFCLVTDAQLSAYSQAAGNSHIWNRSLLPKGASKTISKVVWGKSY